MTDHPAWLALEPIDQTPRMAPEWMSASERQRCEAIDATRRRAQFVSGRRLARRLLAAVYGGDALRDWTLSASENGPPSIDRAPVGAPAGLSISISHSGALVAGVVAASPVGLDIEIPGRRRDVLELAKSVCSPAEQRRLRALEAGEREAHFYALWTLKEAWLKCRGRGLDLASLRNLHAEPCDVGGNACSWYGLGAALSVVAESQVAVRWISPALGASFRPAQRWRLHRLSGAYGAMSASTAKLGAISSVSTR